MSTIILKLFYNLRVIFSLNQKRKWKKRYGKCAICGEANYNLLDTHRLQPGGPYILSNIIVLCANDHRRVHSGELQIIQKTYSTKGTILIYIEDGEEKIKLI